MYRASGNPRRSYIFLQERLFGYVARDCPEICDYANLLVYNTFRAEEGGNRCTFIYKFGIDTRDLCASSGIKFHGAKLMRKNTNCAKFFIV